jgi:hypothetical protein
MIRPSDIAQRDQAAAAASTGVDQLVRLVQTHRGNCRLPASCPGDEAVYEVAGIPSAQLRQLLLEAVRRLAAVPAPRRRLVLLPKPDLDALNLSLEEAHTSAAADDDEEHGCE